MWPKLKSVFKRKRVDEADVMNISRQNINEIGLGAIKCISNEPRKSLDKIENNILPSESDFAYISSLISEIATNVFYRIDTNNDLDENHQPKLVIFDEKLHSFNNNSVDNLNFIEISTSTENTPLNASADINKNKYPLQKDLKIDCPIDSHSLSLDCGGLTVVNQFYSNPCSSNNPEIATIEIDENKHLPTNSNLTSMKEVDSEKGHSVDQNAIDDFYSVEGLTLDQEDPIDKYKNASDMEQKFLDSVLTSEDNNNEHFQSIMSYLNFTVMSEEDSEKRSVYKNAIDEFSNAESFTPDQDYQIELCKNASSDTEQKVLNTSFASGDDKNSQLDTINNDENEHLPVVTTNLYFSSMDKEVSEKDYSVDKNEIDEFSYAVNFTSNQHDVIDKYKNAFPDTEQKILYAASEEDHNSPLDTINIDENEEDSEKEHLIDKNAIDEFSSAESFTSNRDDPIDKYINGSPDTEQKVLDTTSGDDENSQLDNINIDDNEHSPAVTSYLNLTSMNEDSEKEVGKNAIDEFSFAENFTPDQDYQIDLCKNASSDTEQKVLDTPLASCDNENSQFDTINIDENEYYENGDYDKSQVENKKYSDFKDDVCDIEIIAIGLVPKKTIRSYKNSLLDKDIECALKEYHESKTMTLNHYTQFGVKEQIFKDYEIYGKQTNEPDILYVPNQVSELNKPRGIAPKLPDNRTNSNIPYTYNPIAPQLYPNYNGATNNIFVNNFNCYPQQHPMYFYPSISQKMNYYSGQPIFKNPPVNDQFHPLNVRHHNYPVVFKGLQNNQVPPIPLVSLHPQPPRQIIPPFALNPNSTARQSPEGFTNIKPQPLRSPFYWSPSHRGPGFSDDKSTFTNDTALEIVESLTTDEKISLDFKAEEGPKNDSNDFDMTNIAWPELSNKTQKISSEDSDVPPYKEEKSQFEIIPEGKDKFIVNGKIIIDQMAWNTVVCNISGNTYECICCNIMGLCKLDAEIHIISCKHIEKLNTFPPIQWHGLDLIRKFSTYRTHCAVCNMIMDQHYVSEHKKASIHLNNKKITEWAPEKNTSAGNEKQAAPNVTKSKNKKKKYKKRTAIRTC